MLVLRRFTSVLVRGVPWCSGINCSLIVHCHPEVNKLAHTTSLVAVWIRARLEFLRSTGAEGWRVRAAAGSVRNFVCEVQLTLSPSFFVFCLSSETMRRAPERLRPVRARADIPHDLLRRRWPYTAHTGLLTSLAYVRGHNRTDDLPLAQLPPLETRIGLQVLDRPLVARRPRARGGRAAALCPQPGQHRRTRPRADIGVRGVLAERQRTGSPARVALDGRGQPVRQKPTPSSSAGVVQK